MKFILLGALASLALSTSSPAEELANPAAPLGSAVLTGKISCNGYLSVPMTADQEQSLPLQVIANLECGQEVAVLCDAEGYTVNIRTADGKMDTSRACISPGRSGRERMPWCQQTMPR